MANPLTYNTKQIRLNPEGTEVSVTEANGNTINYVIPLNLFNEGEFAVDLRTYTNPGGSNIGCVAIIKTYIGERPQHIRFHVGSGNFVLSSAQVN